MLDPQPFENPLRRVPLLRRRRLVGLQDRVDDRNQRSELRPFRLLGPHVARRRRIAAHLGDRLSAQSENPRRLAPALPLDENKPSNRCISLHRKHPRPPFRIKIRKGSAQKWPGFTPPRSRKMPPLRGLLLLRRVHVTDELRSYAAAAHDLGISNRHERGRWRNNRAENSHQPSRRRERKICEASRPASSLTLPARLFWRNTQAEDSKSAHLSTILSDGAFRYRTLEDGGRQIINYALPGDFVGLRAALTLIMPPVRRDGSSPG